MGLGGDAMQAGGVDEPTAAVTGECGVAFLDPFLSDRCTDPSGSTPHQSEIQTESPEC